MTTSSLIALLDSLARILNDRAKRIAASDNHDDYIVACALDETAYAIQECIKEMERQ